MGFDVNFNNKPVIREAQSMQNDGGGGNLGYFEQGGKDKEKKTKSVFPESQGDLSDTFQYEGDDKFNEEDEFSIAKLIAQIILAVKDFFKKLSGR